MGDGEIGGAGGDDGDEGVVVPGGEGSRGVEHEGVREVVDEDFGEGAADLGELVGVGAGGQDGEILSGEVTSDLDDVVGVLAGAEDDLGQAAAQGAVVVDRGAVQRLEGKLAKLVGGGVDGRLPGGNGREEMLELVGVHGEYLRLKWKEEEYLNLCYEN